MTMAVIEKWLQILWNRLLDKNFEINLQKTLADFYICVNIILTCSVIPKNIGGVL